MFDYLNRGNLGYRYVNAPRMAREDAVVRGSVEAHLRRPLRSFPEVYLRRAYIIRRVRAQCITAGYAGGEGGARDAARRGAAVVVVDAFRASASISVLVAKGAHVIPVASIPEAASVEADFRVGERGSAKVAGFDFGNSPTELLAAGIPCGSTVAVSTTNGTRVIRAAAGAPLILTGSFVNASTLAEELAGAARDVVMVGCGWQGNRASEDEVAAGSIIARLSRLGATPEDRARKVMRRYLEGSREPLKRNSAARRLKRLGYEHDLDFCLAEDTVPVVPRLIDGAFQALPRGDARKVAGGPGRG